MAFKEIALIKKKSKQLLVIGSSGVIVVVMVVIKMVMVMVSVMVLLMLVRIRNCCNNDTNCVSDSKYCLLIFCGGQGEM